MLGCQRGASGQCNIKAPTQQQSLQGMREATRDTELVMGRAVLPCQEVPAVPCRATVTMWRQDPGTEGDQVSSLSGACWCLFDFCGDAEAAGSGVGSYSSALGTVVLGSHFRLACFGKGSIRQELPNTQCGTRCML
jgi:hypothetical protein